jgi:hypothetical protein
MILQNEKLRLQAQKWNLEILSEQGIRNQIDT